MKVIISLLALTLPGCAFFEAGAGRAHYSITPFMTPNGPICCAVDIRNGKDVGKVEVSAARLDDGSYAITLKESGVSATDPINAVLQQNQQLLNSVIGTLP